MSEHVCEISFVKQTPEITAALVKDLKNQSPNWRERYQVKTLTCTRDVRSLSMITSRQQEEVLKRGLEVDLLVHQPQPGLDKAGSRDDDDDQDEELQRDQQDEVLEADRQGEVLEADRQEEVLEADRQDAVLEADQQAAVPEPDQQDEFPENAVGRVQQKEQSRGDGAHHATALKQRKKRLKEKWVFEK